MNIIEHIIQAKEEAIANNIIANKILIDENIAKINGFNIGVKIGETGEIISIPDMIMGLKVEYAKLEPKLNANFLVYEKREESKEKQLLNLLKENKVDLQWFEKNIIEEDICITQTEVDSYFFEHNGEHYLTIEEMQQIVEWLKEE